MLLLSDRVDEWMLSYLREFDGKSLVSVAKGGLDLAELADEEEKKHPVSYTHLAREQRVFALSALEHVAPKGSMRCLSYSTAHR